MKWSILTKNLNSYLTNNGFGTDLDSLPDEVFQNLTGDGPDASGLRKFAKSLTKQRQKLYSEGRLGMIIDGTVDDYNKSQQKRKN